MNQLIADATRRESEILERAIRENATPKIKGPITKGKLKWRGIRLVVFNSRNRTETWVEQRGKPISGKVATSYEILG